MNAPEALQWLESELANFPERASGEDLHKFFVQITERIIRRNWFLLSGIRISFPKGSDDRDEKIGKRASACQFTDDDGVEVVASLNLDQHGNLHELDMWKTDFGKLIRIPDNKNQLRREET